MSEEERPEKPESSRRKVEVRVIGGGGAVDREEEPSGWEEEEISDYEPEVDDVVRLEKEEGPVPVRAAEEMPSAKMEAAPAVRRTRHREQPKRAKTTAVVLMGAVAIVLTVVGVLLVSMSRRGPQSTKETVSDLKSESMGFTDEVEADPHTRAYPDKSIALLEKYAAATDYEDVVPLVRNGGALKERLEKDWKPLELGPGGAEELQLRLHMKEDDTWLTASGEDAEFEPVDLVLTTTEDGGVELDWEASMGIGDMPFSELRELPEGEEVEMRVIGAYSEDTNFHTSDYPEEEWRCFRLSDGRDQYVVWGYARRGSEVEEAISNNMNEGSIFLRRLSQIPMIVRLKNTGGAKTGQLEITEFIQTGWIER